jgi:integrase
MRIREFVRTPIESITVHGLSKTELAELNAVAVRSVGTERGYKSAINQYQQWLRENRLPTNGPGLAAFALEFLDEYAETHAQKTVDHARQALQTYLGLKIPRVPSCVPQRIQGRAYRLDEVERLIVRQSTTFQLATLLCLDAGLRAHECLTIHEPDGNGPSAHRVWLPERFVGRSDYQVFLVKGKGGLMREVAISILLAEALRETRRPQPVEVRDRGVQHLSHFDIGGGQSLSSSFSRASELSLGWSLGLHGLRHAFAQERLRVLSKLLGAKLALTVLSQELGHFRPSITLQYLTGR